MKIDDWIVIHDTRGYSSTEDFSVIEKMLKTAIQQTDNPPGSGKFLLRPASGKGKKAGVSVNGVKPIKLPFLRNLITQSERWKTERKVDPQLGACDITYFYDDERLPFIVEWETGNISSTHRAVNRILSTIMRGNASGGVVILPSKEMYRHLTDRIGNAREVEPYFDLWRKADNLTDEPYYFAFVVIEQDGLSEDVPYLPGGADGNNFRVLEQRVTRPSVHPGDGTTLPTLPGGIA